MGSELGRGGLAWVLTAAKIGLLNLLKKLNTD